MAYKKTRTRFDVVEQIPGGWYGNNPVPSAGVVDGNVVIAPEKIVSALSWLRSRHFSTVRTDLAHDGKGILVCYRLREAVP